MQNGNADDPMDIDSVPARPIKPLRRARGRELMAAPRNPAGSAPAYNSGAANSGRPESMDEPMPDAPPLAMDERAKSKFSEVPEGFISPENRDLDLPDAPRPILAPVSRRRIQNRGR